MQIELIIDGKKKKFTTDYAPLLAKRRYMEIMAKSEKQEEAPSIEQQIEEDDEIFSILTDTVFKNQFTIEQLMEGVSKEYVDKKLVEAVYGVSLDEQENETKNETGK